MLIREVHILQIYLSLNPASTFEVKAVWKEREEEKEEKKKKKKKVGWGERDSPTAVRQFQGDGAVVRRSV